MSDNFPLFPEQASTFAWQVDYLYFLLLALSVFFAVAVFFFLVLFSFKYRRRSEDERPRPSEDSIQAFRRDGFVVVEGLLDDGELERYGRAVDGAVAAKGHQETEWATECGPSSK